MKKASETKIEPSRCTMIALWLKAL